jgi:hypothetical protein
MKNNKFFIIAFLIAILVVMQGANASVGMQFYTKYKSDERITSNYGYMQYGSGTSFVGYGLFGYRVFGDEGDFVPHGQPFQAYILYGLDPIADWNALYPENTIDWCRILVREQHKKISGVLFWQNTEFYINYTLNRTFTANDVSVLKDMSKHFISLQRGDFAEILFDCHFIGQNETILTPASFSITVPTKNCLKCQFVNSQIIEFDNIVANAIQDETNKIIEDIISFILININVLGIAFWISQTLLLISVVGIAFLVLFWVYLFIKSLIRKVG